MRRISLVWLLVFALVWTVLAAPRFDAWVAGGLAVLLGTALHTGLGGRQGARISLRGLLGFAPFFVNQSVRGGIDVAFRALHPARPLDPGFIRYRIGLPAGPARIFFVNCISLLPGTFSAQFHDRELRVHLLTDDAEGARKLETLEEKVARLFGVRLDSSAPGGHPPSSSSPGDDAPSVSRTLPGEEDHHG